ncbi:MAG: hypothetical protein K0R27_156 [Xanthobacteraceae bacterium]|jgi:hypothetical protein|nr:hypothetical protein [Xanthobacteraceae bacterium]
MQMEPISVWEGSGRRRLLTSVENTALFLLNKWPAEDKGSKAHLAAQIAVLQALEGEIPPEGARAVFEAAAERVQILAGPIERPTHNLPAHVARPWDMPWAKKRRRRKP